MIKSNKLIDLPWIFSASSLCIYWYECFLTNARFANRAKQGLFWLVHPLIYAYPAVQVSTARHYRLIGYLKTYIAFEFRSSALARLCRLWFLLFSIIL